MQAYRVEIPAEVRFEFSANEDKAIFNKATLTIILDDKDADKTDLIREMYERKKLRIEFAGASSVWGDIPETETS